MYYTSLYTPGYTMVVPSLLAAWPSTLMVCRCPASEALGSTVRLIWDMKHREALRLSEVLTLVGEDAQSYPLSPGRKS